MSLEKIKEVVGRALEEYKESRKLESAHELITQAVFNNELELGFLDQANEEFRREIEQLSQDEGDEVPDQLERILSQSLLPGAWDEHTEKNAVPSKSGECPSLAPTSSD